jgi:IclR family transcriptional regulator, acetate operon repressor
MSQGLERGIAILEILGQQPKGMLLAHLAKQLEIPLSATHRLLNSLINVGYVRQDEESGNYCLSLKAVSLGMHFLSQNELLELARPIIARLAEQSGELSRLGLIDGARLVWVAKAQGTRSGLRYDPNDGAEAPIHCSASGYVWLAQLPEKEALSLLKAKAANFKQQYGPEAPKTIEETLQHVALARRQGFAMVQNSVELGTSSLAAPIINAGGKPMGVLTISGPVVRLTKAHMKELAPRLIEAAELLGRVDAQRLLLEFVGTASER